MNFNRDGKTRQEIRPPWVSSAETGLKSVGSNPVWVRIPPSAPVVSTNLFGLGLFFIQLWKLLTEIFKLGQIVVNDVRLIRMVCQIVLMVALGFMERVER